jgi:hypothetical protein
MHTDERVREDKSREERGEKIVDRTKQFALFLFPLHFFPLPVL